MKRNTCFVMSRTDSQRVLAVLGSVKIRRRFGHLWVVLLIGATLLTALLAWRMT